MKQDRINDLLVRSLDGSLTKEEEGELSEALRHSADLRKEREAFLAIREQLANQEFAFKPFFSSKVLQQLAREQARGFEVLLWNRAFRRILVPGLAIVLLLLLGTWLSEGSLSLDSITGINQISETDILTDYFSSSLYPEQIDTHLNP